MTEHEKKLKRELEVALGVIAQFERKHEAELLAEQEEAIKKRKAMVADTTKRVAVITRGRDEMIRKLRDARDRRRQEAEKMLETDLRKLRGQHQAHLNQLTKDCDDGIAGIRDAAAGDIKPIEQEYRDAEVAISKECEEKCSALREKHVEAEKDARDKLRAVEAKIAALHTPPVEEASPAPAA